MTYGKMTIVLIGVLVVVSGGSAFALAGGDDGATNGRMIDLGTTVQQQEASQALVFADDYTPGTAFEVVTRLKQGAVDDVLGQTVEDDPIISDTTDYSGYVVRLHSDGAVPGEYGLVFVDRDRGRLIAGSQYEFEADATYFRVDANLLLTGISSVDGGQAPDGETPTPEEGAETPEEETPTPTPETETPTPETETPTPTPETDTPTPTPEAETPTPEPETPTPEPDGADEATPGEQQDGGFLSGIADFFGGLFGGGGDGGEETTTVDGT